VADIAISVSIITLLIFGKYLLPEEPKAEPLDLTEKEGTIKE
jgi:hypothetical protein